MTAETQRAAIERLVDAVAESAVATVEQMMREHGLVLPPTVHAFVEELPRLYVGYVISREFYRGADARAAIARLGAFPASMVADRVLVCWEHQDLCVAQWGPGDYDNAVMILDADLDGSQLLRRYPFTTTPGPADAYGGPTALARWGRPERITAPVLPEPIADLVYTWLACSDDYEFEPTIDALEREGYRPRFAG